MIKNKQIVIYGHKLHSHTHSYIHQNYFEAFTYMGYKTLWVDDKDDLSQIKFDNTIFLTEGKVDKNIPLLKNSQYVLHHCNLDKYLEAGCKFIQLRNYENLYISNEKDITKINNWTFFEDKTKTLFQPWGTDLLPHQIDDVTHPYDPRKKTVNYIGSVWSETFGLIEAFADACKKNDIQFKNYCMTHVEYRGRESKTSYFIRRAIKKAEKMLKIKGDQEITDELARKLVTESLLAPDFRNTHHVDVGYLPCRIFKNISYGVLPGTNSQHINEFFEGLLPFNIDPAILFEENLEAIRGKDFKNKMLYLKSNIRQNHTYISRVEQILEVLSGA